MVTSNLHKAAVLLSSLPKEQVARLLEQLEPEQVTAVTAEISRLRGIHEAERQTVVQEFAAASATHENNRPPAGAAPFQFLYEIPSDDLLELIADEHPQTVAVILAYLPPRQAAAVVAGLSPEGQLSVVSRIATMDRPSPEAVRDVEKGLRSRLFAADTGIVADNRGVASVVRMLNVMEPAAERRLLSDLAEADPGLVRRIRRVMFGADVADRGKLSVAEMAG